MRFLIAIFLTIPFLVATGQTPKEKELKTEIKEVTVFLKSAQIFETGTMALPEGKTLLRVKKLPPFLDEKSIQVKGEGRFTILSVNHKMNHLQQLVKSVQIDSLTRVREKIDSDIARNTARRSVLDQKEELLNANKSLSGQNTGVTVVQIKQALELFETELSKIREEELRLKDNLEQLMRTKKSVEGELNELHALKPSPTAEIEIIVSAEAPTTATFRVTYLVGNAGWYPKYDVRLKDIKSPLELTYKAQVYQNTGTDWKNVKLRFSNADPNETGVAPTLSMWSLSYQRYTNIARQLYGHTAGVNINRNIQTVSGRVVDGTGHPLPGVNVIVKGTTVGTSTGVDGGYSITLPGNSSVLVFSFIGYKTHEMPVSGERMDITLGEDISELQEVVVSGYGSRAPGAVRIRGVGSVSNAKPEASAVATTVVENQTTVEFEVESPYTIRSNGESLMVDLRKFPIEAIYQYYAVPKLERDAFLVARIIKWDQYQLLEGEANLYFEEAFVGRSILNARSLQDTLDISLGRDKNIVVGREKVDQFSKRKAIGTNVLESRGFKTVIRNKKSQAVTITIFDQIPVSALGDISVEAVEVSGAEVEDKSGIVKWNMTIEPKQQKEILLQYEVKYPKRESVILE
jgi:hypothetical protein